VTSVQPQRIQEVWGPNPYITTLPQAEPHSTPGEHFFDTDTPRQTPQSLVPPTADLPEVYQRLKADIAVSKGQTTHSILKKINNLSNSKHLIAQIDQDIKLQVAKANPNLQQLIANSPPGGANVPNIVNANPPHSSQPNLNQVSSNTDNQPNQAKQNFPAPGQAVPNDPNQEQLGPDALFDTLFKEDSRNPNFYSQPVRPPVHNDNPRKLAPNFQNPQEVNATVSFWTADQIAPSTEAGRSSNPQSLVQGYVSNPTGAFLATNSGLVVRRMNEADFQRIHSPVTK
jgi:hypothetical protein